MKIKQSAQEGSGWLIGLGILLVGMALGALLDPLESLGKGTPGARMRPVAAPQELAAFLRPGLEPAPAKENGLETLRVQFDALAAERLQKVQSEALSKGMIIQTDEDLVQGQVGFENELLEAELRIKGDWTDHVDTDKWSLRIKLKQGKLNGMSVFSIQHPQTRGMLWEWFIQAAARREGLLTPRSSFVNVELNGNPMGIYFLEEHFSKELLESQERREGPIVLWDESTHWASLLQVHNVTSKAIKLTLPESSRSARSSSSAKVRAFGEKRLSSIESLSRSLHNAVEQMQALQSMGIANSSRVLPSRRLRAIEDIRGQTIERLVDMEKFSKLHALYGLFQVWHALAWHNMRFYHDPLLDRLEPIVFDCNAHKPSEREIPMFRNNDTIFHEFGSSRAYYNGVFRHLGHFSSPDYLEGLMRDVGPEMRSLERALDEEFQLSSDATVEGMLQRLRSEQAFLRTVIYPVNPIHFDASSDIDSGLQAGAISGQLRVDCWSTTRTPVELRGFEFSNGALLLANACLAEGQLDLESTTDGGIILPPDGSPVRFVFSSDARLTNLESVRQVLDLTRDAGQSRASLELDIKVLFRHLAAVELQREPLSFRRVDPSWDREGGRPEAPSLKMALEQHEFLEFRPESNQLWVKAGEWNVGGDLVVPPPFSLHAEDAILRFDTQSALISSTALEFTRVGLGPQEGLDRWRGVVVLQAQARSHWNQVTVRATDAITRGGWVLTGGITFYRSAVSMTDCKIEGTWAEDGTNIFGADFSMERVVFTDCASDSMDGDFVTGTLTNCTFRDGLADGVDFSGSRVLLKDCQFLDMGDKAVSAGENSQIEVQGGLCRNVSIGIASKDRSQVQVQGMLIEGARNYALAAFIKKQEFGASTLLASDVTIKASGLGPSLVQTGCTLEWNGATVGTEDLDVKQLYLDKILGQ